MARSLLTLAASVTSAVPGAAVSGVGSLTAGGAGRCDSAVVTLADGERLVVRAPVDATAARELAAEALALRALTPGVRELLGFRAPELLGEAGLGDSRALVCSLLPGYHIDAAHIPSGEGAATSIGYALASLHALPHSVVRAEGLPQRTPPEARDDVRTLIDRAGATGRLPVRLTVRWRDAVEADALWRFESTVILGGAAAGSFLFQDVDQAPTVTGVLDWHGLAVGDPAVDLRWVASAPEAADDIFAAYSSAAHRSPDAHLRTRARLYAELEFAQWLVHGHDSHRPDVMDDATALLDALADGIGVESLVDVRGVAPAGVDDAIALLDRVQDPAPAAEVDTSMQTDAYDPEMISLFTATEREFASGARVTGEVPNRDAAAEDVSTAPIDISAWMDAKSQSSPEGDAGDEEIEAERAARAAIQRWASSASE